MNETKTPDWVKNAARVDRPDIKRWYKPEDGALDGTLIWRGKQEHYQTGDVYNAYAVRLADGGEVVGVSERAGLRDLRMVKVGSRVFIRPTGVKALDNGHKLQQFEIFAEGLESLGEPTRGRAGNGQGGPASADDVPF
jgi:hypothetical protein